MGNDIGMPPSRLGITSLSVTTPNIEIKEMEKIFQLMKAKCQEKQKDLINRDDFNAIIKQIDKFQPPDVELFTQLFILFDEQGHNEVDFRNFLAGASVCLISSPLSDKLKFALSIYDTAEKHHCNRGDLRRMMLAINQTTAYFGDPVLTPGEVDHISLEVFKQTPSVVGLGVSHDECIACLLKDETVRKFMLGEGTVRFGSPELATN